MEVSVQVCCCLPWVRFGTRTQRHNLFQFLVILAVSLGRTFEESSTAFHEMKYLCSASFFSPSSTASNASMELSPGPSDVARAIRCLRCCAKRFPFLYQMPDPSVGSPNRRTQIKALQIISNIRDWCQVSSPITETMTALECNPLLVVVRRTAQNLRRQNSLGLAPAISWTPTRFSGRAVRPSVLYRSWNFHR